MDGHEPEEKDFRSKFTEELSKRRNNEIPESTHRPCTVEIVYRMNNEMVENKVKMSEEHFETAIESIDRGDCIVEFTVSENPHVLRSTGSGWLYKMGLGYYKGLSKMIQPVKPGTNFKDYSEDGFNH